MKPSIPLPTQLTARQALRWIIQHRRAELSHHHTLSVLRHVLAINDATSAALQALEAELGISPQLPGNLGLDVPVPAMGNPLRGFWGALSQAGMDPVAAWPIATRLLMDATGERAATVVLFLDSTLGRQFANAVVEMTAQCASVEIAIRWVVAQWMSWRVDPVTSRMHQMPAEVPYLVGWMQVVERKSRN